MKKIFTFMLFLCAGVLAKAQCENYTVQMFSYVANGGPTTIEWVVEELESGENLATGSATFNMFTFSNSATVCLEPGCYNLHLVGNGIFSDATAGGIITFEGAVVPPTNDLSFGTQVLDYNFCTESQTFTCNAEIAVWEQLNACEYIFANNSTTDGDGTILWQWTVDGEPVWEEDGFETAFATDGVHEVCLTMILMDGEIPLCYDTDCIELEVSGCGEANDCPTEIWSSANTECGLEVNFEIGSFVEGEAVNWWFGDSGDQVAGGHFITHVYDEPGVYNVCAYYTSNNCSGVELCTEIIVEACEPECPSVIAIDAIDCDSFYFIAQGGVVGTYSWNFGDGVTEVSEVPYADHTFEANGEYEVHVTYSTEGCEEATLVTWVNVGCDECAGEIAVAYNCGDGIAHLYVDGWSESTEVVWWINTEVQDSNDNWLLVEPNGQWVNVCAYTPGCPEICDEVFLSCENTCNLTADVTGGEGCPYLILQAYQYPEGAQIYWSQNGEQVNIGAITTFMLNEGANQLCAWYEFEGCSAEWCETFYGCGNDCPTEMWSGEGAECGVWQFEIGSFIEGEAVTWYPGDETGAVEGGHFFSHYYAEPGTYNVCAWYTSPECPDGVELCTTIVVEPCGECTEVVIGLDSYVGEGGPEFIEWWISGNGAIQASGSAEYSEEDPYYDSGLCLEDGCYELHVCAAGEFDYEAFSLFFSEEMDVLEIIEVSNFLCYGYTVVFGINSDCAVDECVAMFEPVFTATPGHVEFINTSTYDGDATFLWSYGNGTTSDGNGGNVWYTENGTYEVCLTITTGGGCTDTYCETIVVDDFAEECEGNEVVLLVSTNYPEPGEDTWSVTVAIDGETVGTFPFITCFECPETIELPLCLPNGCYTVTFNSEFGISAEEIIVAAYLLGEELPEGSMTISFDGESGTFEACFTGMEESVLSGMTFFPNPAADQLVINLGQAIGARADIIDASGRIVYSGRLSQQINYMDLSGIAAGVYSLRVVAGDYQKCEKLIISR
ncbi:MAG: PKD domain-containing protein [Flavobacteriales bacterium]|nr:PKD domain-containing protein [Flavobacteriales bacterium]